MPSLSRVKRLLHLPHHDAYGQKEEKIGEENGEEYEEVYVRLILAEKDVAVRVVAGITAHSVQDQVETGDLQLMFVIG